MIYPLAICAVCVVTSIIGTYFVKLGANNSIMGALYKGFIATGVLSLVALYPLTEYACSAWRTVFTAERHAPSPAWTCSGAASSASSSRR